MWEVLSNPITVSVIALCVLCLFKVNVILSLIAASLIAGMVAGMNPGEIMGIFVENLGDNGETAISYLLLGAFAAGLARVGIADILAKKLAGIIKGRRYVLLAMLAVCACISGTLIPIHIAFIPILVPTMLSLMNEMKLDRRAAACALAFGLVTPYATLPIGYGLIFHNIVASNMTDNGMPVDTFQVWHSNWILAIGMVAGMILSILFFSKKREYQDIAVESMAVNRTEETGTGQGARSKITRPQLVSLLAIAATVVGQLMYNSMPFGAVAGLIVMIGGGAIPLKDIDQVVDEGIRLMGVVAVALLVAAGYAGVVKESGAVDTLVTSALAILGGSKAFSAAVMLLIGLLIDMGIGTSFGTVPILAVLYVPLCAQLGFSPAATVVLISAAAVLGDAGSPASDTTLGPTAGLNADGQHDHIWDTCVPTFIVYNIPLLICGFIGVMIF